MANNLKRVFSDIVSIDAWHAQFDENGKARVHVDLSFRTGEVGAEDAFEITFRVSLKRAILKIVIPDVEPLAVIQSTVDREPSLEGIKKVIHQSQIGRATGAGINAQLSNSTVKVSSDVKARITSNQSNKTTAEFESKTSEFDVRQFKDENGQYCWEITSVQNQPMRGKVWDPVKQPRLSVKQTSASKIPPALQAHVMCRREDILIDDVMPKKGSSFKNRYLSNRVAAAKAVIKEKILSLGLDHGDSDNDFVEIVIAESIVVEEVC